MAERRSGKTQTMLENLATWQKLNPGKEALVVGHAMNFMPYMKQLAERVGVDTALVRFTTVDRGAHWAQGRQDFGFFYDHHLTENPQPRQFYADWLAITTRLKAR